MFIPASSKLFMAKKKQAAEKSVEQLREEFFAREQAAYDERMEQARLVAEQSAAEQAAQSVEVEDDSLDAEDTTEENTQGDQTS